MKKRLWRCRVPLVFALYALAFITISHGIEDPRQVVQADHAAAATFHVGKANFERYCIACHGSPTEGVGPFLERVIGRPAGSLSGYNYSEAMRAERFVWDEARVAEFVQAPARVVPGTSMALGPIEAAAAESIAKYLGSQK